jgi:hypothetical protein
MFNKTQGRILPADVRFIAVLSQFYDKHDDFGAEPEPLKSV